MLPDDYKLTNLTRAKLDKLHLHNEWDLLLHLPLRYEDETHLTPIADIRVGMTCLIEGKVIHCEIRTQPRKQLIAQIQDKSGGIINLRFLHFYGNLSKQLTVGSQIRALGEVKMGYHNQEMIHPKLKTADNQVLAEHLTPISPHYDELLRMLYQKLICVIPYLMNYCAHSVCLLWQTVCAYYTIHRLIFLYKIYLIKILRHGDD